MTRLRAARTALWAALLTMLLPAAARADCVVLLHGLARGPGSMEPLAQVLRRQGHTVVNNGYPSTKAPIQELAAHVGQAVDQCGAARVHFVTHSLGGILVRQWLAGHRPADLGRVVMLGPPNAGSELVDELANIPGFALLNGPAGGQLGTGDGSVPLALPPVDYPVGVIAGVQSVNPLYSNLIPGPDDGKVALDRTPVPGMADLIVLPVTHTFMMWDAQAMAQVLIFLRSGSFDPELTWTQALALVAGR